MQLGAHREGRIECEACVDDVILGWVCEKCGRGVGQRHR